MWTIHCALVFSLRIIQTVPLARLWPWPMSWDTISGWTMTPWRGAVAAEWLPTKEAASWTPQPGKYWCFQLLWESGCSLKYVLGNSWAKSFLVFWPERPWKLPERNSVGRASLREAPRLQSTGREAWAPPWEVVGMDSAFVQRSRITLQSQHVVLIRTYSSIWAW